MNAPTSINWSQRAQTVRPRSQCYIDGGFVDAASGERFDCISPIDGRVLAQVARGSSVDIDRAVASARAAFEDGRWSRQGTRYAQENL
ncbi:MAG: aldehyde dehydrogenase family protein [Gammaproteobacteria bacterium]